MQKIWIITKRELASFFDSLIAYIIIIVFLGVSGYFTWLSPQNVFAQGAASLSWYFVIALWTLFFFIPAITMRVLAEENRSGTIEMLSSKAVTDWQIVLGKFWACWIIVAFAVFCTLPYYISVAQLGHLDHAAALGGFIGLLLASAAYIAIGMVASSLSNNQIVAFLVALFISFFFHYIFGLTASAMTGDLAQILDYLSFQSHIDSISRGVLDSKDIFFFLSVTFLGLFIAQSILGKRNWIEN